MVFSAFIVHFTASASRSNKKLHKGRGIKHVQEVPALYDGAMALCTIEDKSSRTHKCHLHYLLARNSAIEISHSRSVLLEGEVV